MLRKELCIKCHQNIFTSGWHKSDEKWQTNISKRIFGWYEFDELQLRWEEEGYIICPFAYLGKGEKSERKITDQPPSKCPYYLENIL